MGSIWQRINSTGDWGLPHPVAIDLFGVPTTIHFTFPIYIFVKLILCLFSATEDMDYVFPIVVDIIILPLTTLIHEFSRVYAAYCVGLKEVSIKLWPLGGIGCISEQKTKPFNKLYIAFAGCLPHPPMIFFWCILSLAPEYQNGTFPNATDYFSNCDQLIKERFLVAVCLGAFWRNVVIFIANFLPIFPLDGSEILANFLLICGLTVNVSAIVVAVIGIIGGILIIIYGIIDELNSTIYHSNTALYMLGFYTILYQYYLITHVRKGIILQHPFFVHMAEQEQQKGQGQSQGQGLWYPIVPQEPEEVELLEVVQELAEYTQETLQSVQQGLEIL